MTLISWNVNGIRACLRKGFLDFLTAASPDILCLQEVRAREQDVDAEFAGYHTYWTPAQRRGYSGTAIFSRIEPVRVTCGLGVSKHDDEGRVTTAEYDDYYVVCVYTPNSKRDLSRLDYRVDEWDVDFLAYCSDLEARKPVIFCGDLNVAHTEADLTHPKANVNNHGFTESERRGFDNIVKAGFIDSFRQFHSGNGHYTWWRPFGGARERNVGWRLDYICLSSGLLDRLISAEILREVMGSDHCPVQACFADSPNGLS